jgi:hypothetical protein
MTHGRPAISYSINLNIIALLPWECVSCVRLLQAKKEILWLIELERSAHERGQPMVEYGY